MNDNKKQEKDLGGIIFVDDFGKENKYPFVLTTINELPDDIYSNHVIVSNTPHEFTILFNIIQTPFSIDQIPKDKKIKIKTVAKIIIPKTLMEQLIKALQINLDNSKKGFLTDESHSK